MTITRSSAVFTAVISANWAGWLLICSGVGLVPALVGNAKVMRDPDGFSDDAFRIVFVQARTGWRRDLPVTLALWFVLLSAATTALWVAPSLSASGRIFFLGLVTPAYLIAVALITAYVQTAAQLVEGSSRSEVLWPSVSLVFANPVRSFAIAVTVVALTPVWAFPPVGMACGLPLPAWLLRRFWDPVLPSDDCRVAQDDDWQLKQIMTTRPRG